MKKFLSIALAVMMMFTLVLSASAKSIFEYSDLTDVDANKDNRDYISSNSYFEDALQMMTDLEILTGRTDGSLDASASVNRLEFIVMLYKFTHGGSVPSSAYAEQHPFKDIPWGNEYVGWAYSSGIAAGISADKFGSTNHIKMVDALTFLIKALGVKPEFEGFTGENYASKASVIADSLGVMPGDFNAANVNSLTRAECAVLFNFALNAPMQKYDVAYNGTIAVYTREPAQVNGADQAAINKFFGYKRYEGEIVANNIFALKSFATTDEGKTLLSVKKIDGLDAPADTKMTLSTDMGLANIGRGFYMYAKLSTTGAISKYSGLNVTGSSTSYGSSYRLNASGLVSPSDNGKYKDTTKISDKPMVSDSNVYVNYSLFTGAINGNADKTVNEVLSLGGTGNTFRLVKSGFSTYYIAEKLTAAKVISISSGEATIRTTTNVQHDVSTNLADKIKTKYIIGDSIEAGDYILCAPVTGSDAWTVTKATLLEGTAESFNADAGNLKIDTTYYGRYTVDGSCPFTDITTSSAYKFYMVNNKVMGFVLQTGTSSAGSDYCYVSEFFVSGGSTKVKEAKVFSTTDKSGKVYTVSSSSDDYDDFANGTSYRGLYKFSISGGNVILADPTPSTSAQKIPVNKLDTYDNTDNFRFNGSKAASSGYFQMATNAGSVTFLVTAAGGVTVVQGTLPSYSTAQTLSTKSTIILTGNPQGGVGTATTNRITGTVKAALFDEFVPNGKGTAYVWGTADYSIKSNLSGSLNAFNGSDVVTYEFNADAGSNSGLTITTQFADQVLKLEYWQPSESGATGYKADAIKKITIMDPVQAWAETYEINDIYELGKFEIFNSSVRIYDNTEVSGDLTQIYWEAISKDSPKFYLIDLTGENPAYSNITSTIGSFDLENGDWNYTFYGRITTNSDTSGVGTTDITATPKAFWIVIENA